MGVPPIKSSDNIYLPVYVKSAHSGAMAYTVSPLVML